jgi:hypothetical protein
MKRRGSIKSLEKGLAGLVSRLDRNNGGAYAQARVGILWQEISGAQVTSHTTGAHLKDGVLVVYVDNAGWATELTAMSETYRKKINSELGKDIVKKITFTVSRKVIEEHRLRRTEMEDEDFYFRDVVESLPLSEVERAQVEASAQCIPDTELREAAVKATVADLEWKKGLAARNSRETAREGS